MGVVALSAWICAANSPGSAVQASRIRSRLNVKLHFDACGLNSDLARWTATEHPRHQYRRELGRNDREGEQIKTNTDVKLGHGGRFQSDDQNRDHEDVQHGPLAECFDPMVKPVDPRKVVFAFDPDDPEQPEFGTGKHEREDRQHGEEEVLTFVKQREDSAKHGHGIVEHPELGDVEKRKENPVREQQKRRDE